MGEMWVVSDDVLERLTCAQCKKYLSVYPVKVYPNRAIKCGRCTELFDAGVISLFGLLAEKELFRCVNRFDGCYQLLNYKEVAVHEKTCIGGMYECSTCFGSFTGTGYEIFMHFKEQHKDKLLIDSSEFVLNLDNEHYRCYLHRKNDLLFFVYTSYYRSEKEIILSVSYLGKDQDAAKIYQMFTLLSVDGKVIHKSKKKCCSSVTGRNTNFFTIAVKKNDFVKNVVICKFEIIMEDLGTMLMLPSTIHKTTPFRFGSNKFKSQGNGNNTFGPTSSLALFNSNITDFKVDIPWTFDYQKTSTTHNKQTPNDRFCPVRSKDVACINGSERDIVVSLQSITIMEKFNNLSFEEIRLTYYQTEMERAKKNVTEEFLWKKYS